MLTRLIAGAGFVLATSLTCPVVLAAPVEAPPSLILVSGGCGPAFHRTPFATCAPNRQAFYGAGPEVVRLPPPCPRGYHRDPDPARRICYPNL